jgi:hypothetical protein
MRAHGSRGLCSKNHTGYKDLIGAGTSPGRVFPGKKCLDVIA